MQPAFLDWSLEPPDYLEEILGAARAEKVLPLNTMKRMGIRMSGGSDAPCTPPDPIAGMAAACNHFVPGQSLTPSEALQMFTLEGAWASFDDDLLGSLAEGKRASFALLDGDPVAGDPADLTKISVLETHLLGRRHVPGRQGWLPAMLRGLVRSD